MIIATTIAHLPWLRLPPFLFLIFASLVTHLTNWGEVKSQQHFLGSNTITNPLQAITWIKARVKTRWVLEICFDLSLRTHTFPAKSYMNHHESHEFPCFHRTWSRPGCSIALNVAFSHSNNMVTHPIIYSTLPEFIPYQVQFHSRLTGRSIILHTTCY
mgnify:CR=1 FL=1